MRYHQQPWMNALVSPAVFLLLPTLWVFSVFALVHIMMTKRIVDVKRLMQIYNVVQIVVCSYMVWGLAPCIGIPNIFGLNSDFTEQGEWFVFVHYLSKYLDWFDTLWIVLSKKKAQLSFLHIYHHGTIVPVWGMLLLHGVGNGTCRYGAFINSLTHVIMYSHYLWTSLGLKNPFKRYITMWQMTQFYSCLVHAFVVLFFEYTDVREFAWVQVVYQLSMVYLFGKMMSWVPACIPEFNGTKDEKPISIGQFCSGVSSEIEEEPIRQGMAWKQRYMVIRGQAYDVTNFDHPGGVMMIDLAVGRDATVMFESAHLRLERAEKFLESLPKCSIEELEKKGFDFGRKETWPTPSESELYGTIRKRVLNEVLKPRGMAVGDAGARGVPVWHFATVTITWLTAAVWFVCKPGVLNGMLLGWALTWIGVGVQHTANHGGLTKNPKIGYLLGLLNDLGPGGSSIVWRYHHQVSHHAYCNDLELDADSYSSFPILRLDPTQKWQPYHRFQWLYAPVAFAFLWISIQVADLSSLLEAQFFDVKMKGTKSLEIVLAIFLKILHFTWLVIIPFQIHGFDVMLYPWMACFGFGGIALAMMFIVSHNVDHTKEGELTGLGKDGDWARQQIETSTSWGGVVSTFFAGGLNLQIEHHLFPCMAHNLYPNVQEVVKDECKKRGIKYNAYPTLLGNTVDHFKFLHKMGHPEGSGSSKKTE